VAADSLLTYLGRQRETVARLTGKEARADFAAAVQEDRDDLDALTVSSDELRGIQHSYSYGLLMDLIGQLKACVVTTVEEIEEELGLPKDEQVDVYTHRLVGKKRGLCDAIAICEEAMLVVEPRP
jgi:hypothetical protein